MTMATSYETMWSGRTLAAAIRSGMARDVWGAAASRYLTLYARAANGRRNHSPVGIYRSGGKRRCHACYVCGEGWTTAAEWPEPLWSRRCGAEHIARHAAEHAHEIVRYMVGLLPEHEIGAAAKIERLVDERSAERVAQARARAVAAEALAAAATAERARLIARVRALGLLVTPGPVASPGADRFQLLDM